MKFFAVCSVALIACVGVLPGVLSGGHGVVDDEIWHHVTKVLSEHEGRGKVLLSHPEPAHLVDAYTKVYHHEPHYEDYHHYSHGDDHHYHLNLHEPTHYHGPVPVPLPVAVRVPVPIVRFGPPPPHRHHSHSHYHYKK